MQTHVFAHLITRAVYDSPAAWMTARLSCRLLEELLEPDVYDAQLVGTRYSLSASETGLHLSFHGFSGVVPQLAEVVAAAMAGVTLQQVQARWVAE
jgi:secreted Zn-dependent insulinase-like peptidase